MTLSFAFFSLFTVHLKLQQAYEKSPKATMLVLLFSNRKGCENTEDFSTIHKSNDKICAAFKNLSCAVCQFQDYCHAEIIAVYEKLAEITFPKICEAIFIGHIGHGKDSYISVPDGYIPISKLRGVTL